MKCKIARSSGKALGVPPLAALYLGAGVEQQSDCLIVHDRQAVQSLGKSVDWMDIGGQHGRRCVLLRHTHRHQRRPYPICISRSGNVRQRRRLKPEPRCSWKGHSRRVCVGVRDESAESCRVVSPLRLPPVIRALRLMYVSVVRWNDKLYGGYKWMSRFETPCIPTWWSAEQVSMLHGTAC